MSDAQDDPLLGLLTDIAEGVATLAARIDGIETRMAAQNDVTNEALATIAEIATRTYYASKPSSALPDDIINANVMDAMIERWPLDWVMRFPTSEFRMLKDLQSLSAAEIEAVLRQRAVVAEDATNAQRIRYARILTILNEEMDKRFKAQQQGAERDGPERSRCVRHQSLGSPRLLVLAGSGLTTGGCGEAAISGINTQCRHDRVNC